jgi:hypothetical protein
MAAEKLDKSASRESPLRGRQAKAAAASCALSHTFLLPVRRHDNLAAACAPRARARRRRRTSGLCKRTHAHMQARRARVAGKLRGAHEHVFVNRSSSRDLHVNSRSTLTGLPSNLLLDCCGAPNGPCISSPAALTATLLRVCVHSVGDTTGTCTAVKAGSKQRF